MQVLKGEMQKWLLNCIFENLFVQFILNPKRQNLAADFFIRYGERTLKKTSKSGNANIYLLYEWRAINNHINGAGIGW